MLVPWRVNPPGKLQDGKGPLLKYEGLMADRRIGGTDRESYVRGTQKNGSRSPGLSCSTGHLRDRCSMAKLKAGTLLLVRFKGNDGPHGSCATRFADLG